MNKSVQNVVIGSVGIALGIWFGNKCSSKENPDPQKDNTADCGGKKDDGVEKEYGKKALTKNPTLATATAPSPTKPTNKAASHGYSSSPLVVKRRRRKPATTNTKHRVPALFQNGRSIDYSKKYAGYQKAQITFYNPTLQDLEVSLWGANRSENTDIVSDSWKFTPIQAHVDIQATAYNPANDHFYLLSQLGNTIEVMSTSGASIAEMVIEPNTYPGVSSPVALAVNTRAESTAYGHVYVVNSIADTLSVFDTDYTLIQTIDLPSRPMDVVYHAEANSLYIVSLLEHQILQLDAETYQTLYSADTAFENPLMSQISADGTSLYIAYLNGHAISVYDTTLNEIETFENVLDSPKTLSLSLQKDQLLIVQEDGQVIALDTQSGVAIHTPLEGVQFINTNSTGVYQVLQDNGTVSKWNDQLQKTQTYSVPATHLIPTFEEEFLLFDGLENRLYYELKTSMGVQFDEDYEERKQDFKYNPALLKHVRFSMSGELYFPSLKLIHQNATGKVREQTLSLNDYRSPQNFQNIFDATGLEGSFLDGQTAWKLRIAAGQRISAILYYTQMEMYRLMPEHSRKVIPII